MIDTADVKGLVGRIVQRYVGERSRKSTRTDAAIVRGPHEVKILDRKRHDRTDVYGKSTQVYLSGNIDR